MELSRTEIRGWRLPMAVPFVCRAVWFCGTLMFVVSWPSQDLSGWSPFDAWRHSLLLPPVEHRGKKVSHQDHIHDHVQDHVCKQQTNKGWQSPPLPPSPPPGYFLSHCFCHRSGSVFSPASPAACWLHSRGGLTSWLPVNTSETRVALEEWSKTK